MTLERMIELLDIEHACVRRNKLGICNRKCGDCELAQNDEELLEMYTDVIGLLKEQEPIEPIRMHISESKRKDYYRCGKCGDDIYFEQNFCVTCGREVKWDG